MRIVAPKLIDPRHQSKNLPQRQTDLAQIIGFEVRANFFAARDFAADGVRSGDAGPPIDAMDANF
jgi:hypothetical protein